MNDRYVKQKFSIAAEMLAGRESLPIRVAKAWTEISAADGYQFADQQLQADFDWLMSKIDIFAVGDGQRAKGTIAEWDRTRTLILKIHSLIGNG